MNVIHAVWIDDDDIALLARSGAHVAHNPISNLRLGSGVMPFRRLRDAGVPICLGTDEAIADDSMDMVERLQARGPDPYDHRPGSSALAKSAGNP